MTHHHLGVRELAMKGKHHGAEFVQPVVSPDVGGAHIPIYHGLLEDRGVAAISARLRWSWSRAW